MGTFNSLEEAQAYFQADRFAACNGITLDALSDEEAVCSVVLTENHRNAMGGVMGGVIFTLADLALAAASNHDHRGTVALDVNIHFLSSAKGSCLTATAKKVKSGRTTSVYEISVEDDTGRQVALVIGTGYKL